MERARAAVRAGRRRRPRQTLMPLYSRRARASSQRGEYAEAAPWFRHAAETRTPTCGAPYYGLFQTLRRDGRRAMGRVGAFAAFPAAGWQNREVAAGRSQVHTDGAEGRGDRPAPPWRSSWRWRPRGRCLQASESARRKRAPLDWDVDSQILANGHGGRLRTAPGETELLIAGALSRSARSSPVLRERGEGYEPSVRTNHFCAASTAVNARACGATSTTTDWSTLYLCPQRGPNVADGGRRPVGEWSDATDKPPRTAGGGYDTVDGLVLRPRPRRRSRLPAGQRRRPDARSSTTTATAASGRSPSELGIDG